MQKSWGFVAACGLIAVLACGSGKTGDGSTGPDNPAERPKLDLPKVPTEVNVTQVEPGKGNKPAAASPILDTMAEENARAMSALARHPTEPAYFLAYTMTEERTVVIEAEGGGLVTDADETERSLDVDIRVGSPGFDNTHMLANDRLRQFSFMMRRGRAPFGTDPLPLKRELWLETDRRYREAELILRNLKTQKQLVARHDKLDDFSAEKKETFIQDKVEIKVDKEKWRARVRDCSKSARRGVATRSGCRFDLSVKTVYYVNSEGSRIQRSWPTSRFSVSVGIKADDGMPLSRTEDQFGRNPEDLPSVAEIGKMIRRATDELDALYKAPVVDPYVGPAILEGRAAAVFFHEVFGHRIEGHRQRDPDFGKTFTSEIGNRIMPEWLTVYDDPTIRNLNGVEVNGFYRFDDEGVRAQRALLVERGVLKGFVKGRTPLAGFAKSNGHGRRSSGLPAVSRQGNLVVEASRSVTQAKLRELLIAEIKKQGKPFGLIFTDISGGFTNTSQFGAQAFKVIPTLAYRLYPDGKTELVRGVDIVGTPLTVLASIKAAARPVEIFNGMCGAESGWVPVSASAPSLMLEKIEVERSFKPSNRPPVLSSPAIETIQ